MCITAFLPPVHSSMYAYDANRRVEVVGTLIGLVGAGICSLASASGEGEAGAADNAPTVVGDMVALIGAPVAAIYLETMHSMEVPMHMHTLTATNQVRSNASAASALPGPVHASHNTSVFTRHPPFSALHPLGLPLTTLSCVCVHCRLQPPLLS